MKNSVSIKGTREGLTVTLATGEYAELITDLTQHLDTQGAFFRGGTVALQAGEYALKVDELTRMSELLSEHEMALRSVVTTNATTQASARALGLRLVEQVAADVATKSAEASPARASESSRGTLVRHLVRSGQVVRHTGHVVVIGDVNVGGEIIAGGDVVIWGRLYGTVHAGAMGNNAAVVCALELAPLQLRIGDLVARPAEDDRPKKPYPEVACIRDKMIVVEPWDRTTRGGV
jgi:septum site-determining protein MinC